MKYILFIAFILSVVSCAKHDGYTLTGLVPEHGKENLFFWYWMIRINLILLTARKYREVIQIPR